MLTISYKLLISQHPIAVKLTMVIDNVLVCII